VKSVIIAFNLTLSFAFILVPLMSTQQMMYPQLPQTDNSAAGWPAQMPQPSTSASAPHLPMQLPLVPTRVAPTAPQPATPEEYDMPPPSYLEAISKPSNEADNEDEGLNDQQPFNPRYPVFNFGILPPANAPPPYTQNQAQGFINEEKKTHY
jgi:hypothetical protein